jgi:hypothetical protein
MKQVTPSNREHYTHGCWLKNKEGVTMSIYFGVDFHARQQFIKWCDTADGEVHEQQLSHRQPDEVREFYTRFQGEVIVGLEASGYSSWFETMLQQIGRQVWVGNPTEIRRRARSRQKTDRRDAELLLDLLLKDEFPRLHRLTPASLEVLRQLRYRHRLVQMRTRIYNALQAIALSAGVSLKAKLRTNKGQERLCQPFLALLGPSSPRCFCGRLPSEPGRSSCIALPEEATRNLELETSIYAPGSDKNSVTSRPPPKAWLVLLASQVGY